MRNLAYWISRFRDFTASSTGLFPLVNWRSVFFKGKALGPEEVIKSVERDLNLQLFFKRRSKTSVAF